MKARVIPTIDISQGKAVLIKRGNVNKILNCPFEILDEYSFYEYIQIIDIDKSKGVGDNKEIIHKLIKKFPGKIIYGGGIKNNQECLDLLSIGVHKIIIGSNIHNIDVSLYKHIIVSYDINYKLELLFNGREIQSNTSILKVLNKINYHHIFITFHDLEGTGKGIDITNIKKLIKIQNIQNIQISIAGGISSLQQIKILLDLNINPVLGFALHTKKLHIKNIIPLYFDDPIIPTIIQNTEHHVLGLVYSNKQTLSETIHKKMCVFYSRSNNTIWFKGHISGHKFTLVTLHINCSNKCLLFVVKELFNDKKEFCHNNTISCFYNKPPITLNTLFNHINSYTNKNSYTNYLINNTDILIMKLYEELMEFINFSDKNNLVHESSDLLYFICVFMIKHQVSFQEILYELSKRSRTKTIDTIKTIKTFNRIGISKDAYTIKMLEKLGFEFNLKLFTIKLRQNIKLNNDIILTPETHFILTKPKDCGLLLRQKLLDGAIVSEDCVMDINYKKLDIPNIKFKTTEIVIVKNITKNITKNSDTLIICSEFPDITYKWMNRMNNKINNKINKKFKIIPVKGTAESYLLNGLCDMCVVVRDTGETISNNNLVIVDSLFKASIKFIY